MKIIFTGSFLFITLFTFAQIKGVVVGANGGNRTPIYGAKIKLLKNGSSATSNEDGTFELVLPKELPDTLIVKAMGYYSDTIPVTKEDRFIAMQITLYSEKLLPEIVVGIRRETHSVSRMKTLHVEELTSGELRKAACCNLSESFETNASVDVNITDAVSGAKKIQMMGLDGVYTQIQMENIPYLRGLESSFGLNSISGTWIESIQITKGTGNVVNGFESMAGLINVELKKPSEMERFYANGYGNMFGRAELNLNSGKIINERWSTGWLAHASGVFAEMDKNRDGFRDLPMGQAAALLNRWAFQGKKMESQFGINTYIDQKYGGQIGQAVANQSLRYAVNIDSKHIDAFAKTGFFLKKPYNSIGVVYNLKYQNVEALFGQRNFEGEEKRGYINAIFDGIIGTTDHKIKLGMSGVYTDITQHLQDTLSSDRTEIIPGVFSEYTYTGMRFTAVAGIRADYHNEFGFQASPRLHTKYILTEHTDLRFTAGKGWRVPNYIIDNISLLATSAPWILLEELKPEISWNLGGSIVHEFKILKRNTTFSMDFYHTLFENQLIVDRDNYFIRFNNQQGTSYSNSFQTEASLKPTKTLELRFAYKFLDVKAEYANELREQVMIPRHRGFFNAGYLSRNKRWEYDLTVSVFGKSRLPGVSSSDEVSYTNIYPIVNTQLTHVYKKWDFYLGVENLTNFRQSNPIMDAANPFGSLFDATQIWGPVMGTMIYTGFRYAIKREKKKE
ncbi:MAG: TonB-dependent receptor [Cryomorphaceae bacterium]|jgi:outer membrane receptor protein involved in Fe transport|nr:TonB-dependent receptor [Cryomorphaceae bacterium]